MRGKGERSKAHRARARACTCAPSLVGPLGANACPHAPEHSVRTFLYLLSPAVAAVRISIPRTYMVRPNINVCKTHGRTCACARSGVFYSIRTLMENINARRAHSYHCILCMYYMGGDWKFKCHHISREDGWIWRVCNGERSAATRTNNP